MAGQPTTTKTHVPEDDASRIIRKLDSIEKKLTIIVWIVGLPILLWVAGTLLSLVFGLAAVAS